MLDPHFSFAFDFSSSRLCICWFCFSLLLSETFNLSANVDEPRPEIQSNKKVSLYYLRWYDESIRKAMNNNFKEYECNKVSLNTIFIQLCNP